MQEELRWEKAKKAALIEREKLARELHDGIAQSLFLLSVKVNVIKHAKTNQIWIQGKEIDNGWICQIKDQGIGFTNEKFESSKGYGLQIIQDRAKDMEWKFSIKRIDHKTIIELKKESK